MTTVYLLQVAGVASTRGATMALNTDATLDDLVDECVRSTTQLLVEAEAMRSRSDRQTRRRFERLFRDPGAIDVTMMLTDRVMRAASPQAAIGIFRMAARRASIRGFGVVNALGLRLLVALSFLAPRATLRIVHSRIRSLSSSQILDSGTRHCRGILNDARQKVSHSMSMYWVRRVLGDNEARERLETIVAMMRRRYVNYVSVKPSSITAQLSSFDVEGSEQRMAEDLRVVYRTALAEGVFVNLDMEEYRDLRLTLDAFMTVLAEPAFHRLQAGIVIQAYLPEAHASLLRLIEWSKMRVDGGGAPVKVRLVKGANLAMEHAEAALHGWRAAPYASKAAVDASYLRLLDLALRPEYADALRVGVASHNLFHVHFALATARRRGVGRQLDIEMLEGMANAEAKALVARGERVLLYAPVTRREDFASAVAYLVRRLDENTAPENYLRASFVIGTDRNVFAAQSERFRRALSERHDVSTASLRHEPVVRKHAVFENSPNADPTNPVLVHAVGDAIESLCADQLRHFALVVSGVERRSDDIEVGRDPSDEGRIWYDYQVATAGIVNEAVASAVDAGASWFARPATERAEVLQRASRALLAATPALLAVMARDAGKPATESIAEVSEAADFASYYATFVRDDVPPKGVVVVVPPWNFPLAIPAGGVLAALAAGNAVILKPAPETVAVAHALASLLWASGVPKDVLQFVPTRDDEVGRALVTHRDVDAVILTGSYDTAKLFLSWRPDMCLLAETSGKNAMVVAGSADVDSAVKDLVDSAFSHGGQKCSAASLAIVVSSVVQSSSFLRQLEDTVRSLDVGSALAASSVIGSLIHPPDDRLLRALTTLEDGEAWLVEPQQLDDAGYRWRPGVKVGVRPASWSHHTEWFGPVLAIMEAPDVATATDWQNSTDYGLTAGLQSLDDEECTWWLEHVHAGNVYLNRGTTGAVVRRQPFGGWRHSSVGPTHKAGGPHYVDALREHAALADLDEAVESLSLWWNTSGSQALDVSGLEVERNIFRYRRYASPIIARIDDTMSVSVLDYLASLGTGLGIDIELSGTSISSSRPNYVDESITGLIERATPFQKVRWLSAESIPAHQFLEKGVALDARALAQSGGVEGPRWLCEQSVAIANHRYGNVGAGPRPDCPGLGETSGEAERP